MPLVKEIMTSEVVKVPSSASAMDAAKQMADAEVGTVAVVDENDKLLGFVTDRKITTEIVAKGENPKTRKVKDIMTSDVITSNPDLEICEVVNDMHDKNIWRMPIVDNDSTVVGFLSASDVAKDHAQECDSCGKAILEISSKYV